MFKSFRIQNFRSIKDSGQIDLARLNIFIGPNNSGKSSILATLLLLKQSLQDKDPDTGLVTSGPFVDLGSYLDIVPKDPVETPVVISFALDRDLTAASVLSVLGEAFEKEDQDYNYDSFELKFWYDSRQNNVTIQSFNMRDSARGKEISGELKGGTWKLSGLPS